MTQYTSGSSQLSVAQEQNKQREIDRKLENEFIRIRDKHRKALLKISARAVLGPSVIRVFQKGTKRRLKPILENINIDELLVLETQEEYKQWFKENLEKIAEEIVTTNPKNKASSIYPGYKWGHAAKVLNLFIREVVEFKRYFSDGEAKRISKWLYIPVDSLAIKELKRLGVNLPFNKIKAINTEEKFYDVQEWLGRPASEVDVLRIWFDDMWGDRLEDEN